MERDTSVVYNTKYYEVVLLEDVQVYLDMPPRHGYGILNRSTGVLEYLDYSLPLTIATCEEFTSALEQLMPGLDKDNVTRLN